MKITQLSVFLENRKGRLHEALQILGEAKIDIKALTIAENEDFGVLRTIVSDPNRAQKILKENGFVASVTDIVAVEVDDNPGGLAQILGVLDKYSINVEYMYAFVEKKVDKAIVVFRFDDSDRAISILSDNNINVLGGQDIKGL